MVAFEKRAPVFLAHCLTAAKYLSCCVRLETCVGYTIRTEFRVPGPGRAARRGSISSQFLLLCKVTTKIERISFAMSRGKSFRTSYRPLNGLRKRLILSVLALAILAPALFAQATEGSILGTVSDSSGAAVTGARIQLTGVDTGLTRTTCFQLGRRVCDREPPARIVQGDGGKWPASSGRNSRQWS